MFNLLSCLFKKVVRTKFLLFTLKWFTHSRDNFSNSKQKKVEILIVLSFTANFKKYIQFLLFIHMVKGLNCGARFDNQKNFQKKKF